MGVHLDANGFGKTWKDFSTDRYEGYDPRMTDYHMHDYYEISLILEGNVKVLLPALAESGTGARLLLMRPRTPHFIVNDPSVLYRRRNVLFSGDFFANGLPDWHRLAVVFEPNGAFCSLSSSECEEYAELIERMERESDPFRIRLYLLLLLSLIAERMEASGRLKAPPTYVTAALAYVTEHYRERILAEELARYLGVGRTTLMTAFRAYTGTTLGDYVLQCRLKNAIRCLKEGMTEQQTAEECGFSDACNLIRGFKRRFHTTPRRYLAELRGDF